MSSNTDNLNLLKKNPTTDGADTFNIDTMLNENWNKIDAAIGKLSNLTTTEKDNLVEAINEIVSGSIDTVNVIGNVSSGTVTLMANKMSVATFLTTAAKTIALPTGLTSGIHYNCDLLLTLSALSTINQPTVNWVSPKEVAPILDTAGAVYRITYETFDGGNTWYGYWS